MENVSIYMILRVNDYMLYVSLCFDPVTKQTD